MKTNLPTRKKTFQKKKVGTFEIILHDILSVLDGLKLI